MKNCTGNMWDVYDQVDAFCLTTNGFVKRDGAAVMGRGIAKTARDNFKHIDYALGQAISRNGNITQLLGHKFVALPVKPAFATFNGRNAVPGWAAKYNIGDQIPGWAAVANTALIKLSIRQLVSLADLHSWQRIALPKPGCGNGQLDYSAVEPILKHYLDDRFEVWDFR
jgi:hypothetical protein